MSTYYIDLANGSSGTGSGNSFANRAAGFTSLSPTPSSGDTVKIMESGIPSSLGNATWTNSSNFITLAAAATKTVDTCETAWTLGPQGANLGTTAINPRQGTNALYITPFGAGSGKIAYKTLGGVTDYSGYRQITFWIRQDGTFGNIGNNIAVCLCSDTTGDTIVNEFILPVTIGPSFGTFINWTPITIDNGSALGNNIHSVALYQIYSVGASVQFVIDNIEAVQAPSSFTSLSLNSLISKNTGNETWYAIKSIVGTQVELDGTPNAPTASPSANISSALIGGYKGTTSTVTTYKRETIQLNNLSIPTQSINFSGSTGSYINISGGWDSASMSTQSSETWMDAQTSKSTALTVTGSNLNFSKLYQTRGNYGFYQDNSSVSITGLSGTIGANNCARDNLHLVGDINNITVSSCMGSITAYGFNCTGGTSLVINNIYNSSNNFNGFVSASKIISLQTYLSSDLNTDSMSIGSGGRVGTISIPGQMTFSNPSALVVNSATLTGTNAIVFNNTSPTTIFSLNATGVCNVSNQNDVVNCIYNATTDNVSFPVSGYNQRLAYENIGSTLNNNKTYTDGGTIAVDTADPNSAGGLDYKISVTSVKRNILYPIQLSLAKIAVNASTQVTFSAYIKKSHASNISADMVILGGQIAGVPSDLTTSATTTSYAKYTLTFTPSQTGVVEVIVNIYSTTGSTTDTVKVADISVSQL